MKQKNKIWLSQAAANIPNDVPLIFWDTCALVDVIRLPYSTKKFGIRDLEYYEDIARWIAEGKVISVTSALVSAKFDTHYPDEYNALLKEQSKRIESIKEFTQYLPSASSKNKINNSVDRLHIENCLECLSNKLCRNTTIMRQENKYARMADFRTCKGIPPSNSKVSYKDCYIWATFLSVLQSIHPTSKCIFFTTNPKDFAPGEVIHAQIKTDCISVGGDILLHIGQLHAQLKAILEP